MVNADTAKDKSLSHEVSQRQPVAQKRNVRSHKDKPPTFRMRRFLLFGRDCIGVFGGGSLPTLAGDRFLSPQMRVEITLLLRSISLRAFVVDVPEHVRLLVYSRLENEKWEMRNDQLATFQNGTLAWNRGEVTHSDVINCTGGDKVKVISYGHLYCLVVSLEGVKREKLTIRSP